MSLSRETDRVEVAQGHEAILREIKDLKQRLHLLEGLGREVGNQTARLQDNLQTVQQGVGHELGRVQSQLQNTQLRNQQMACKIFEVKKSVQQKSPPIQPVVVPVTVNLERNLQRALSSLPEGMGPQTGTQVPTNSIRKFELEPLEGGDFQM